MSVFDIWYVNQNDLIGGYAIGTEPGVASVNRQYGDIADMLTYDHALELVELHRQLGQHQDLVLEIREFHRALLALAGEMDTYEDHERSAQVLNRTTGWSDDSQRWRMLESVLGDE